MTQFVDDNGTSCFIDDHGAISWVDDLGNTLSCISVVGQKETPSLGCTVYNVALGGGGSGITAKGLRSLLGSQMETLESLFFLLIEPQE